MPFLYSEEIDAQVNVDYNVILFFKNTVKGG
jgi:hypothetical protein